MTTRIRVTENGAMTAGGQMGMLPPNFSGFGPRQGGVMVEDVAPNPGAMPFAPGRPEMPPSMYRPMEQELQPGAYSNAQAPAPLPPYTGAQQYIDALSASYEAKVERLQKRIEDQAQDFLICMEVLRDRLGLTRDEFDQLAAEKREELWPTPKDPAVAMQEDLDAKLLSVVAALNNNFDAKLNQLVGTIGQAISQVNQRVSELSPNATSPAEPVQAEAETFAAPVTQEAQPAAAAVEKKK